MNLFEKVHRENIELSKALLNMKSIKNMKNKDDKFFMVYISLSSASLSITDNTNPV